MIFKKLHEDNVAEKISDGRFLQMSAEYEAEQQELIESTAILSKEIADETEKSVNTDNLLKLVKKYSYIETLTPVMLREFIEKIEIHERVKIDGKRTQAVDIYYNFIGLVDITDNMEIAESG